MKKDDFNPRMELFKILIGFAKNTADLLAKQGPLVAMSVCGCIVFFTMMERQKQETREEIANVRRECREDIAQAKAEGAVLMERAKGEVEACHREREKLAVKVASLESRMNHYTRKR